MRKIVIANQKGGVAKTTTAVNLAAELAHAGAEVLLIDMDPQNSATSAVFGRADFEFTTYHVLIDRIPPRRAIQYSENFGIDIIPSDIELSTVPLRIYQEIGREKLLADCIGELDYDYLIIDAPPSLDLLTVNALTAANELIVPICPEYFSLKVVTLLEEIVEKVKTGLKADLTLLGVLITRFRERIVTNEAKNAIINYFGEKVFTTLIPENIKIEEAHNAHLPVYKYDSTCKGAQAYASLAQEVINAKVPVIIEGTSEQQQELDRTQVANN